MVGAGAGEKPPFRCDEGHGEGGTHRSAAHASGVGIDPGGHVHGEYRGPRRVHGVDGGSRGARHGTREPGAEQRVHHHTLEGRGYKRFALHPGLAHGDQHPGGVATESARIADDEGPHVVPGLPGAARDHESVAAVVSGTAYDRDSSRFRPAPDEGAERSGARPVHELRSREATFGDGQPLDLANLRRGPQERTGTSGRRGPARGLRRRGSRGNDAAPGSIRGCRRAPGARSTSRTPRPRRAPTVGRGS